MKCLNCQADLILLDGKKSGFCHACGSEFTVESDDSQHYSKGAIQEIAKAVVDEQERRAQAADPGGDPPADPDADPAADPDGDPPADPPAKSKWDS